MTYQKNVLHARRSQIVDTALKKYLIVQFVVCQQDSGGEVLGILL